MDLPLPIKWDDVEYISGTLEGVEGKDPWVVFGKLKDGMWFLVQEWRNSHTAPIFVPDRCSIAIGTSHDDLICGLRHSQKERLLWYEKYFCP